MKDKILMFVIGFLVGAILATGGYIVYEKVKAKKEPTNNQFPGENGMRMMFDGEKMGNPPQMPSGEMPKDIMQGNGGDNATENTDKQKGQERKNKQVEIETKNETNV